MFNDDGLPGPSAGRGGGVRRSYANKLLCDRSGRRPNAKVRNQRDDMLVD